MSRPADRAIHKLDSHTGRWLPADPVKPSLLDRWYFFAYRIRKMFTGAAK